MLTEEKVANRYAVVDLEATSAGSSAKIIQIGIVLVEAGEIVGRYQTDVNPHEKLDGHIKKLTGITDQQLAVAPDFGQVAREVFELLEDRIFVAHNVKFDANLLAEALFFEGFELRTPRVDTVELAQVFYPTLDKYNLSLLCNELGIQLDNAHTALADAQATAELLIALQEKMASLPMQTIEQILSLADNLIYESRLVIEEVYRGMSTIMDHQLHSVHGLVLRKPQKRLAARRLSVDFSTNLALMDLEHRASQLEFSDLIAEHLESDPTIPYFIQAQAGLGKTFGYLVTLLAKRSGGKILVTVPTKLLQDQIMEKEGWMLTDVFRVDFHNLKGTRNYLKLDAFYQSLQDEESNRLVNRYKMQLLVWLLETESGDLDEIKQQQRFQSYFDSLRHDGNLPAASLFKDVDFWEQSYRRAQECQVLITNHAYFLERVQDDKDFVKGRYLVIDEVQKMVLALEQFSHARVNLQELLLALSDRLTSSESLLEKRILESIQFHLYRLLEHKGQAVNLRLIERLRQDVSEISMPFLADLNHLLSPYYEEYWLESQDVGEKRQQFLCGASLSFLNFSRFLPEETEVLGISATLEISPSVMVPGLLGFEEYQLDKLDNQVQHQQVLYLPRDLPAIWELPEAEYAQFLADYLQEMKSLQQAQLVLFTSNSLMLAVSELLDEHGISHLTQHKNGNAQRLKQRFVAGETKLLLGSAAFWEGVDFANLDEIVIHVTRIPFDNPQDVFSKKINRAFRMEHRSPFYDYTLPMAILKLKQALGRSTRKPGQISALVLLDKRALTKRYSKQILSALESEIPLEKVDKADLVSDINQFFKKTR